MADIYMGSTPFLRLYLTDQNGRNINMSNYDAVWVCLKNGSTEIKLEKSSLTFNTDYTFEFSLTQSETLSFNTFDPLLVQVRAIKDGSAIVSEEFSLDVKEVLKGGIIS